LPAQLQTLPVEKQEDLTGAIFDLAKVSNLTYWVRQSVNMSSVLRKQITAEANHTIHIVLPVEMGDEVEVVIFPISCSKLATQQESLAMAKLMDESGFAKNIFASTVEDCCDALGTTYHGQMVGTFGDIGTLSFYPAHHITMGEGGAVLTNSKKLKTIAESFRDWSRDCFCAPGKDNTCSKRFCFKLGELLKGYDHKYTYSHLGYNLKIKGMRAACGVAQLEKAPQFIQARKDNFTYLKNRLKSCETFLDVNC
jgi:hypothetical protein